MLTDKQKAAIRNAADTLYAIGKGKEPDLSPDVALASIDAILNEITDHRVKEAATRVISQLYIHTKAAVLREDIEVKKLELAALEARTMKAEDLKHLASDLHQATARL